MTGATTVGFHRLGILEITWSPVSTPKEDRREVYPALLDYEHNPRASGEHYM
jgi:hypothetical protein